MKKTYVLAITALVALAGIIFLMTKKSEAPNDSGYTYQDTKKHIQNIAQNTTANTESKVVKCFGSLGGKRDEKEGAADTQTFYLSDVATHMISFDKEGDKVKETHVLLSGEGGYTWGDSLISSKTGKKLGVKSDRNSSKFAAASAMSNYVRSHPGFKCETLQQDDANIFTPPTDVTFYSEEEFTEKLGKL